MNALPCIACGRALKQVSSDADCNQPYVATAFISHGHYGSTAFDPLDGHYLEINICDLCLILHQDRVLQGRDKRPIIEQADPLPHVVGWEDVNYRAVPWVPTQSEIDHVIETARKEFEINNIYEKEASDEA